MEKLNQTTRPNCRPIFIVGVLVFLLSLFLVFAPEHNVQAAYPTPGDYSLDECDKLTTYSEIEYCVLNSDLTREEADEIEESLLASADDTSGSRPTECLFSSIDTSSETLESNSNWDFLCAAVPFFGQAIDWSNTQIAEQVDLDTSPDGSDDSSSTINQFIKLDYIMPIWSSNILPIANIILALVFIVIIYGVATGGNDGRSFLSVYNIKRILPRLIVAAILINISFYVCVIFNDLINIVALGVSSIFQNGAILPDSTGWHLGNMMQTFSNYVMAGEISIGTDDGDPLAPLSHVVAVLYCIMCIPVLLASLGMFLLLAFRELIIVILMLASPIVFAISLLPSQANLTSRYISTFVKLLLIYPAIVAVVMICFQVESYAYDTFLRDSDENSLLPIVFIAVVSLVPFITIKPFYKAYSSLFSKISGQARDTQTKISTGSRSKTAEGKSNWLVNSQRRIKAALSNQSNSPARQRSIKEKLEKQSVEKSQNQSTETTTTNQTTKSTKPTKRSNFYDTTISNLQNTETTNIVRDQSSNITRTRSESLKNSYLNNSTNQIANTPNIVNIPPPPALPNDRLEQSKRAQPNPSLTLDRMNSKLKVSSESPVVNNPKLAPTTNTTNNFQAPSRNPTRDTTAATHERPSKHQSRKPLADSLNAQKFADVTNLTNNSKVDQIVSPAKPAKNPPDVKLSKNTEDLLVKNQAAIAKSLDGLSAQSTNPQATPPDTKLTQVPDNTEPDITPDDIETAINGDIPTNPETKLRLPETPSKVKNLKKALKNILS